MHWLLIAGPAWAAGVDPLLEADLDNALAEAGPSVVVCAAGAEAERLSRKVVEESGSKVPVARIAAAGTPEREVSRCMASHEALCGIRVALGEGGRWTVESQGECHSAASAPTAPAVPVVGGPAEMGEGGAATAEAEAPEGDDDPAEADAAEGDEGAPESDEETDEDETTETDEAEADEETAEAEAAEPQPEPVDWTAAQERYRLQAMEVQPPIIATPDSPPWLVRKGSGSLVSARYLAEEFDDVDVLERMQLETARADRQAKILNWVGIGLLALSPTALLIVESGDRDALEDRLWTGVFMAGTGGMALSVAPMVRKAPSRRQLQPSLYYSRETADELVRDGNRRLYSSLGLDSPEAKAQLAPEPEATDESPAPEGTPDEPGAPDAATDETDAPAEPTAEGLPEGEAAAGEDAPEAVDEPLPDDDEVLPEDDELLPEDDEALPQDDEDGSTAPLPSRVQLPPSGDDLPESPDDTTPVEDTAREEAP